MSVHTFDFDVVEIDDLVKNAELFATAKSLTLDSYNSGMNILLRYWMQKTLMSEAALKKPRHIDAKAIFISVINPWVGRKGSVIQVKRKIVGWCTVTRESDLKRFSPKAGHASFQVFVNPDYRGLGYGTALLYKAMEVFSGDILDVYGEDREKFFGTHIKAGYCKDLTA